MADDNDTDYNFNASDYDPIVSLGDFDEPIPAGQVIAVISQAKVKELKYGKGFGINLGWQVVEGPYKSRMWWELLCTGHKDPDTAKKHSGMMSARLRALGKTHISNLTQIMNIPIPVKIKIEKSRNPEYPDRNKITSFPKSPSSLPSKEKVSHGEASGSSYSPGVAGAVSKAFDDDDIPF